MELPLAFKGTTEAAFDGLLIREAGDFEFNIRWERLRATNATHTESINA